MSLPLELLELIFKYCHLGCLRDVDSDDWEEPSLSHTLRKFPYNLAAVDPSWDALLLRHRDYWTGLNRAVFNVDSKAPTHIDDAKTFLRYILDEAGPYFKYHVDIIRRSKVNPDDAAEKDRVKNLMDLLAPEIGRCRSFLIDVHASPSLPSVNTYFNDQLIASCVVSLEYLCDVDDSGDTVFNEPYDYGYAIQGSHITSTVLDGGTFRKNTARLRRQTKLKSLTISHLFRGATNSAELDVQRALETVLSMATTNFWGSNLKSLKFRDINFAPCDTMREAFSIFMRVPNNLSLEYLSFEDVDPQFLEDLTRSIFLNADRDLAHSAPLELHLLCGASSRDIPVNVQSWQYARLVPEGYDRAHLTASYPFDQETFPSSELHLINCPGFTDSDLEILSKIDPGTKAPLFSANLKLSKAH